MIAKTIDDVITILEEIIQSSEAEESTMGYFACLYQKVTINVKNRLNTNYFHDDKRMEQLDVVFANRYLSAYFNYKQNKPVTKSWKTTFDASEKYSLIVLQHLLLGMNAHINLDLGIAASEISDESTIHQLQSDFNKINDILGSLVDEVQSNLAEIWPTLFKLLKFAKKVDDFLINFSMTIARDGAWKFANALVVQKKKKNIENSISQRDSKISELAKSITNQGVIVRIVFFFIRLGERGNPSDKIRILRRVIKSDGST